MDLPGPGLVWLLILFIFHLLEDKLKSEPLKKLKSYYFTAKTPSLFTKALRIKFKLQSTAKFAHDLASAEVCILNIPDS